MGELWGVRRVREFGGKVDLISFNQSLTQSLNASRIFQHFLDRRVALENAAEAVLPQRHHAVLDRLLFQNDRGRSLVDQSTNGIRHSHQLVDSFAPSITGAVAVLATFPAVEPAVADFVGRK